MAEKQNTPEIRFEGFTDPWEQRKLGELCELNPTAVLPDSFEYVDLESVAGTDMISHRREEKLTAPSRAQRLASFGDIFYQTVRPYQKNNYFYELPDEDYVFSTGYAQLRPLCDGRFLFSSLQRDQFVSCVLEHCTGTSYPAINANDLAALFLAVPIDAEEQRLVGSILKPIDSLITLHQRKHDKLCTLKKSMLDKMFPKPGETEPEIRFEGFTDPWEQRKFSDLVLIERGGSPRPIDAYITEDPAGLNWVKIGDAPSMGRYITTTSEKIKPEGLSKTRQVYPGDLVLSNSMSFGRPYIMAVEGCIHDGWLLIRDTQNQFDPVFLCHMLGTPQMLDQYRMFASGSTVNNLNKELVGNAMVPLPDRDEQVKIGNYLDELDGLITLHQRMCPIFSFCAHGSRTNFAQTLQGWLQILRYPRPIPKMLVSPSAPASGVFGTAKGAFICASSSAGASTSSPSARKNFITSSTLCCRESLSSP